MTITATVQGGAVQLTGNPVYVNCSGASVPAGAYEYMITLRIISQDSKLEGSPFHIARTPDTDGTKIFDISGILDQPFEVSFQYPATSKYIEYPFRAFNIQIQPGERYINSTGLLVENWFAVSDVFQMLKGGLSPRQNAMFNASSTSFYDTYIAGKKFLTPRPGGDYIHPSQPIKLWFMATENCGAQIKIKAFYSDDTTTTVSSSITLNTDSLYELNCNPTLYGLSFEPSSTKRISYFDVWLEYSSVSYSDVRRFTVDLNYCERPYFLFFANSLGGIDDVFLSGYGSDHFNITNTLAYRPVRSTDTVFTPTIVSPNKSGQNKWIINSGWKTIPTLQYFRDLILSKQAWFLYPNISVTTFSIIPIIIQNEDVELFNRLDDNWNIDIEFIEAHRSRFSFDNKLF